MFSQIWAYFNFIFKGEGGGGIFGKACPSNFTLHKTHLVLQGYYAQHIMIIQNRRYPDGELTHITKGIVALVVTTKEKKSNENCTSSL
jgi:hypothetical protein